MLNLCRCDCVAELVLSVLISRFVVYSTKISIWRVIVRSVRNSLVRMGAIIQTYRCADQRRTYPAPVPGLFRLHMRRYVEVMDYEILFGLCAISIAFITFVFFLPQAGVERAWVVVDSNSTAAPLLA